MNTEVWQERAKSLLEKSKAENHFVIKDSGVWNACESGLGFDDFPVDCEIERCDAAWTFAFDEWKPALAIPELADKDVPSLPFPFTAPELAAFMLYGMGALVGDFFGDWEDGPSIQSLNELPAGQSELRALVKGAYVAYRLARGQVDELDMGVKARETAARKAYRNSPRDRELSQAFGHAKASWDAAHRARLTAMVRCLLGVGVDIESSEPATGTQPQAAPAAPTSESGNWKMVVQAEAAARFKRLRAAGSSPTVYSILDDMVTWCHANDVKTSGCVYPSAGYLRTHVLGGKHWTPPR